MIFTMCTLYSSWGKEIFHTKEKLLEQKLCVLGLSFNHTTFQDSALSGTINSFSPEVCMILLLISLILLVLKHHNSEGSCRNGDKAPCVRNFSARWRWVDTFILWLLCTGQWVLSICWIEGWWVGDITNLDVVVKKEILASAKKLNSSHTACSQSLYWAIADHKWC